jgi:hypothetical protein
MARKVAWRKLRASIPGNEQMKFQDIVTMLLNNIPEDDDELEGIYREPGSQSGSPRDFEAPSPQRRALSEAVSSGDEGEGNSEENIDPYLNGLGENEFDPDDIEDGLTTLNQGYQSSKSTRGMIRDAVNEAYDNNGVTDGEEEHEDGDMAMADRGSVDLDASSQKKAGGSKASRLLSPISFELEPNLNEQEDIASSTHSDEEDVDMDIPARRPYEGPRHESVDLDMD